MKRKILWEVIDDSEFIHLDSLLELKSMFADGEAFIGHTNFPITLKDIESLNNVDGVEYAYWHSKYRFSVGSGKLFKFSQVQALIQEFFKIKKIDYSYIPIEFRDEVSKTINDLFFKKYWVLKLKSNGEPEFSFGSPHKVEVSLTIDKLMQDRKTEEKILTNLK